VTTGADVIDEQRPDEESGPPARATPSILEIGCASGPIRLGSRPECADGHERPVRSLVGDEAHDQGVARHTAARAESRVCDESCQRLIGPAVSFTLTRLTASVMLVVVSSRIDRSSTRVCRPDYAQSSWEIDRDGQTPRRVLKEEPSANS